MMINALSSSYYSKSDEDKKPHSQEAEDSAIKQAILELEATDTNVRAHEAAHIAAGGDVVIGGASFEYTRGPDGKMYAVAGEVPIDTSEANTPEETVQKARQIVAAAMAPADPSPTDYRVAATAAMMEMKASLEISKELREKNSGIEAYKESALESDVA